MNWRYTPYPRPAVRARAHALPYKTSQTYISATRKRAGLILCPPEFKVQKALRRSSLTGLFPTVAEIHNLKVPGTHR